MTTIDSIDLVPNTLKANLATIKVIGVGGGGCNAVTRLYKDGINDVELLICNTDTQPLLNSPVPEKLQLGTNLTKGLGAGCDPERGRNAALESVDEFKKLIGDNIELAFITAGMGGGTGTGAAPVLAKAIRDLEKETRKGDPSNRILIVGVVTYPFADEGKEALERAYNGVMELTKYTDCILIVDNQKMYETCMDSTMGEAYKMADDVLDTAVRGIADIVGREGYVNVDMNDIKTVMRNSGMVIASTGYASGENRSIEAVEKAFTSPLLNDFDFRTAKNLIVNITAKKPGLKMAEIQQIMEYITEFTGDNIEKAKKGFRFEDNMDENDVQITIVATGFKFHLNPPTKRIQRRNEEDILIVNQDEDNEDNSIIFATPLLTDMEPVRLKEFNPAFTAIFTPDMKVTDFETEPALIRRERLKKEFSEKQHNETN